MRNFSAALQFLVCLDSTCFVFLILRHEILIFYFGCGDMHNDISPRKNAHQLASVQFFSLRVVAASRGRLTSLWSAKGYESHRKCCSLIWLAELCIGSLLTLRATFHSARRNVELSHFQQYRVTASKPCLHRNLESQWSAVVWVRPTLFYSADFRRFVSSTTTNQKLFNSQKLKRNKNERVLQFTRRAMIEKRRLGTGESNAGELTFCILSMYVDGRELCDIMWQTLLGIWMSCWKVAIILEIFYPITSFVIHTTSMHLNRNRLVHKVKDS